MGYKVYASFGKEKNKQMSGRLSASSSSWKILRLSDEKSPYSFEKTVEEYGEVCLKHASYSNDARIILNKLKDDEK